MTPPGDLRALREAIRAACPSALLALGRRMAEQGDVMLLSRSADEIELRVLAGRARSREVSLFPLDGEWSCDCDGQFRCCEHVAAALAMMETGAPPESASRVGRIVYRLTTAGGVLGFARRMVTGDEERPLPATLVAMAAGSGPRPRLHTGAADMALEARLPALREGPVPSAMVPALLEVLRDATEVTLDGVTVRAGRPTTGLVAQVRDDASGPGVEVRLVAEVEAERVLTNGVLVRDGVVQARIASGLSPEDERRLREGMVVRPPRFAELAAGLLPRLRRTMAVHVTSERLPGTTPGRPRLHVATSREGRDLLAFPTLVYGDPPVMRVDGERVVLLREGTDVPVRSVRAEAELLRRAEREHGLLPGRIRRLEVGDALPWVAALLRAPGLHVEGTAARDFAAVGELAPTWGARGGLGEVQLRAGDGREASLREALAAWERGERWLELPGGGFAALPEAFLTRHEEVLRALLGEGDEDDAGARTRFLGDEIRQLAESLGAPALAPSEWLPTWAEATDPAAWPALALPSGLQATLRPYQELGVRWLAWHRDHGVGALLADDMGLGKTLQAACALHGRTLVVAPTSVIGSWARQLRAFLPELRVEVYHGAGRRLASDADVTLTTHAILRLDSATLHEPTWDTVILDEAQAIKNPDSLLAAAAHGLRAGFRIALSGTPLENRLEDLWSLMRFVEPGVLGSREATRRTLARGAEGVAALRRRVGPFLLRRRKAEVAQDLPARTEVMLECELSAEEREVYAAVLAATRSDVVARLDAGASALHVLEALLRLRQAATHTGLLPGRERVASSAKLQLLAETLADAAAQGHRALVFSQWTRLLDRVEPVLCEAGLAYLRLDGTTRDRAGVVAAFQDPAGPPVLLVSLKAGGTGIDLTAADHVFLCDPWWNPAVEDQAADRAHRIGQTRPVVIHRLVARDTVDAKILELQRRKRGLVELLLAADDAEVAPGAGPSLELTRAEVLELLG